MDHSVFDCYTLEVFTRNKETCVTILPRDSGFVPIKLNSDTYNCSIFGREGCFFLKKIDLCNRNDFLYLGVSKTRPYPRNPPDPTRPNPKNSDF
jgi:hypothetical protein